MIACVLFYHRGIMHELRHHDVAMSRYTLQRQRKPDRDIWSYSCYSDLCYAVSFDNVLGYRGGTSDWEAQAGGEIKLQVPNRWEEPTKFCKCVASSPFIMMKNTASAKQVMRLGYFGATRRVMMVWWPLPVAMFPVCAVWLSFLNWDTAGQAVSAIHMHYNVNYQWWTCMLETLLWVAKSMSIWCERTLSAIHVNYPWCSSVCYTDETVLWVWY